MKLKQARLKNMRGFKNIRIRVNIAHEYAVRNSKRIPLRKGWFQNEVSLPYQGLDLVYTLIPRALVYLQDLYRQSTIVKYWGLERENITVSFSLLLCLF